MASSNSKPQIHQFIPILDYGDAIGNHAFAIREFLRNRGHKSEIFAWHAGKGMERHCHDYRSYPRWSSSDNVVLYHFGTASPLTEFLGGLPDRKAIIYHNITPAEFFKGLNSEVYFIMKKGRLELEALSKKVDLAIADSDYNREELLHFGFRNTSTVPLLIDFDRYKIPPDSSVIRKYKNNGVNILFVGRIGPNKKQEDVIRVFSFYKKYINRESRLFIIGSNRQVPEYSGVLDRLVDSLGVEDVHFTGEVSQSELNAYYDMSDIFLCMSEHEGFCIPLLECMYFGVPILAYKSSAITDTLNGSGVTFTQKDLPRIAELMDMIVSDRDMKERIIKGQKERLRRFKRDTVENELINSLSGFLN